MILERASNPLFYYTSQRVRDLDDGWEALKTNIL